MKEKLMIIIETFLNLFSDWNFFTKLGKKEGILHWDRAHNRPLRYTEKIPGLSVFHIRRSSRDNLGIIGHISQ